MTIKIKVTKAVLVKSAMCGLMGRQFISTNCAISLAVRDFFPHAQVSFKGEYDTPFIDTWVLSVPEKEREIDLPAAAGKFIDVFDRSTPTERVLMPEVSFEIEVPQSVIDKIGISEAYRILSESKTLELVNP